MSVSTWRVNKDGFDMMSRIKRLPRIGLLCLRATGIVAPWCLREGSLFKDNDNDYVSLSHSSEYVLLDGWHSIIIISIENHSPNNF